MASKGFQKLTDYEEVDEERASPVSYSDSNDDVVTVSFRGNIDRNGYNRSNSNSNSNSDRRTAGREHLEIENTTAVHGNRSREKQRSSPLASNAISLTDINKIVFNDAFLHGACSILIVMVLPLLIAVAVLANKIHDSNSGNSSTSDQRWSQYFTEASYGSVATDHVTCSRLGTRVLQQGGNAVDAAIASALCLGVVSPASSGIGGGCFILIHNATNGENTFIDSREYAPSGSSATMFEDDPIQAQDGGLAIAVLAEVKGLRYAWEKFGSHHPQVSWKSLVMPAAQLAKKWVIDRQVAVYLQKIKTQLLSGKFPALSALYLDSNGQIKKAGDVVRQPALSYTLSMIAEHGASYIYEDLAEILSQEIQSAGGIVTADDIRSYNIRVLPALTTDVMGHTYLGVGGSSSGGAVVAGILKFMTSFGEQLVSQGSLYNHRLAEAYKHAFAIRLSLGDPQYINTTEPIDSLLSDDYMQNLFFNGDDSSVLPIEYYGGKFNMLYASQEDHGTSHISVLDKDNNAVSLTTTVNTYFGSKVVSPTTGILFNDEMDDFSIPNSANYFGLAPAPSNYPEPFKRPLSSMSPSIVLDRKGKVRLIGGASGGPRIITATAQVILNYLGKGMRLLDAVVAPRIHSQLLPPTVYIEDQPLLDGGRITATQEMALALSSRGHNLTYESGSMAVTQFIAIDPDTGAIEAVSDPRKDGSPAGY